MKRSWFLNWLINQIIQNTTTFFSGGNYVTRIMEGDDREKEMEDNVENVAAMVGNLRNMAIDAGQEIDNQNHLITRISNKAAANQERVKDANERATNML